MKVNRRIAWMFGYDIIPLRKSLLLEHVLRDVLERKAIEMVLDVGGGVGRYGRLLREMGFRGRIQSFEPNPASYEKLVAAAQRDPQWDVSPLALGSSSGHQTLHMARASHFSSFLAPSEFAKDRFEAETEIETEHRVEVARLDDVLEDLRARGDLPERIFLKMDTQGYDLEVLQGTEIHRDRIVGMQSEISVLPIYEGMKTYLESLDLYQRSGFELVGLFPVTRDPASLRVVECDCVMVRKEEGAVSV